jgi:hypothetical protein
MGTRLKHNCGSIHWKISWLVCKKPNCGNRSTILYKSLSLKSCMREGLQDILANIRLILWWQIGFICQVWRNMLIKLLIGVESVNRCRVWRNMLTKNIIIMLVANTKHVCTDQYLLHYTVCGATCSHKKCRFQPTRSITCFFFCMDTFRNPEAASKLSHSWNPVTSLEMFRWKS